MKTITHFLLPLIALLFFGALAPGLAFAQLDIDAQIEQFKQGTTAERVNNVHLVSALVVRDVVNQAERTKIINFLKQAASDKDAVVRLNVNVELLKIGAGNQNTELVNLAMKAADDKNINVRRGILKFYGSFFSGRMDAGISQKTMLLAKLDDPDLETRYQVARTLLSWGITDDKVLDILLDCLELTNYRTSITYALTTLSNRDKLIAKAYKRLKENEHGRGVLINLIARMGAGSKQVVRDTFEMYDDGNVGVRAAIVDGAARVGLKGDDVNQLLQKAANDEAPEVRSLVLPTLLSIDADTDQFVSTVAKFLNDDEAVVRDTAASYVSVKPELFSRHEPALRKLLANPDKEKVFTAVSALGSAGPMAKNLVKDVSQLLNSESAELRNAACWTLLEISDDKSIVADAINRELQNAPSQGLSAAALIGALAESQPTDALSKRSFLKYLEHPNENIRFACVAGLSNYDATGFAETMINLPGYSSIRVSENYNNLDRLIVETIAKQGEKAAKLASEYIKPDNDVHVRLRAIRILAAVRPDDSEVQKQIVSFLDSDQASIQFAAADSLKNFPSVSKESLDKIVELMDGNNRQLTVGYMQLVGQMGDKALPLVPDLCEFLSGKFRNRFNNDAKKTILSLARFIDKPVPELTAGDLTVQKLDCLCVIGKTNPAMEKRLRDFIEAERKKQKSSTNLNTIRANRRNELMALAALANGTKDNSQINAEILAEFKANPPNLAFLAIGKLKQFDQVLVDELIKRLPEAAAIESLSRMGNQASSATNRLKELANSDDPRISTACRSALWKIEDSPELAIATVKEILADNALQPGQIMLPQRQSLWELLRYLHVRHSDNAEAQELLNSLQNGRFANLRSFVRRLDEPR